MKIYTINGLDLHWTTDRFSVSDTRKNPDNVGIIYPIESTNIKDHPSYSCILKHEISGEESEFTYIACGEYRLINCDSKDTVYSLEHSFTIVHRDKPDITDQSQAMHRLGIKSKKESYIVSEYKCLKKENIDMFLNMKFTPEFIIDENNLEPLRRE